MPPQLVERFGRDTGVSATFVAGANTTSMPLRLAVEIVPIVHEGLIGLRKHSRARRVLVRLLDGDGGWVLTIEDDGCGFRFEGRLADACHCARSDDQRGRRIEGDSIGRARRRIEGGGHAHSARPSITQSDNPRVASA